MICETINVCKGEGLNKTKDTWKDSKGCGSKYLIVNNNRKTYHKIDFENCVYKGRENETKCDYGLLTDDTIYYIELKGRDVKKGVKQLLSTLNETEKCFDDLHKKARIIASKISKPDIIKRMKEYRDLVTKIKGKPIIVTNKYTEKI